VVNVRRYGPNAQRKFPTAREALAKLRVKPGLRGTSEELDADWSIGFGYDRERKQFYLRLRWKGREQIAGLAEGDYETRSRKQWATERTYRLTEQGIDKFAPMIEKAVASTRAAHTPNLGRGLTGGRSEGMCAAEFDPRQLRRGTHHELEHTDDVCIAESIAADHLAEDPLYYEKLERMEAGEPEPSTVWQPPMLLDQDELESAATVRPEALEDEPIPPTVATPYAANRRARDEVHADWKRLVNMSAGELERFMQSAEGREAGLSRSQAQAGGIRSGQDSARAIVRMKRKPAHEWTSRDWDWARRQVAFIKRMSGARGPLRDEQGQPTRKLLALKIWGHDPEQTSNPMVANPKRKVGLALREGGTEEMEAEVYGDWAAHWTLTKSGERIGATVTYIPEGMAAAHFDKLAEAKRAAQWAATDDAMQIFESALAGNRDMQRLFKRSIKQAGAPPARPAPKPKTVSLPTETWTRLRTPAGAAEVINQALVQLFPGQAHSVEAGERGVIIDLWMAPASASQLELLRAEHIRVTLVRSSYLDWHVGVSAKLDRMALGKEGNDALLARGIRFRRLDGIPTEVVPRLLTWFEKIAPKFRLDGGHTPNKLGAGNYWVWVITRRGDTPMLSEGPYGPHDLPGAKTYARISATEGTHDRAVSFGRDPQGSTFEIVRVYRTGTGERTV
jgi:hypothetical protein